MTQTRVLAFLLGLVTLAVFLPATRFTFVSLDDPVYITENPVVNGGFSRAGVEWAFTTFHGGNWHPLTWISHMIDCQIYRGNAGGHHLTNILFHAVNAALLLVWLERLTGRKWPAVFIAALFAWHPLRVESVAWISERKDVLSTFFALLALLEYTRYARENRRPCFWRALIFFSLGLLAKPMLVTLPFLLLLLDFWPLKRLGGPPDWGRLVREKWPFLLLSLGSCIVTFIAQKNGGAVATLASIPPGLRLENALTAVTGYLLKLLWPADLCVLYPLKTAIPVWQATVSMMVLLSITVVAWRWRRQRPWLLLGWLWFLGTLVPVIGLVQVGVQAMADRYTYIPSIGFFLAAIFLAEEWLQKLGVPRVAMTGLAVVICLACLGATGHQLPYWRDSETLFRRALAVTPDNPTALVSLGAALDLQGRFDESLPLFQAAEKLDARRYDIHNNLGNVLDKTGRYSESLAEYEQASQLLPNDAELHDAVGLELLKLRRIPEALQAFDQAVELRPHLAPVHLHRAQAFYGVGRDTEALTELHAAVAAAPDDFEILATAAHYLAANDDASARNGPLAVQLASRANELSGNRQPIVLDILGMALAESGDYRDAQSCEQRALDLATQLGISPVPTFQTRLAMYQNGQPWHESFLTTNIIKN